MGAKSTKLGSCDCLDQNGNMCLCAMIEYDVNFKPGPSCSKADLRYPLDSDLAGGQRYPPFEQLGPGEYVRKMSLQSVTQVAHIFSPPCNILYILCSPTLLHFQDGQFCIGYRTFHSLTTLRLKLFMVYNTESSFATGPLLGSTSHQRWVLPF